MLSYAHGSADTPLLGVTVGRLLDNAARRWPDQEAAVVVDQNIRWSWRELRDRARAFGAGLLALGLEPGDRVGMLATNRAEWLVTQFGTAYAGLILVNINPCLSNTRTRICAQQGRLPGSRHRVFVQDE